VAHSGLDATLIRPDVIPRRRGPLGAVHTSPMSTDSEREVGAGADCRCRTRRYDSQDGPVSVAPDRLDAKRTAL